MNKLNQLSAVFDQNNLKTLVTLPTLDEIKAHPECLQMTDLALLCGATPTTLGLNAQGERCFLGEAWTATAGEHGKTVQSCAVNGVALDSKMEVKSNNPTKIKGVPLIINHASAAGFALQTNQHHENYGYLTYKGAYCYAPMHLVNASGENWSQQFNVAHEEGYLNGQPFNSVDALWYDKDLYGDYENFVRTHNFGKAPCFLGSYRWQGETYAQYGKPGSENYYWVEYDKVQGTLLSDDRILLPMLFAEKIAEPTQTHKIVNVANKSINFSQSYLGKKLNEGQSFLKSLATSTILNHAAELDREQDF